MNKNYYLILFALLFGFFVSLSPLNLVGEGDIINKSILSVSAAQSITSVSITPSKIPIIISKISGYLKNIAFTLTIFFFVLAGVYYLIGGAKPDYVKKAHNVLIFAVIGTAVVLISAGAQAIIYNLIGP